MNEIEVIEVCDNKTKKEAINDLFWVVLNADGTGSIKISYRWRYN